MRRFAFSLQKVLEHRQRLEEQAFRAFSETQRRVYQEREQLAHLMTLRTQCLRQSFRGHRLAVQMLDVEQTYLSVLEQRLEAQRQRVAQAEALLDERRRALIEAQRERKVLERLREKHYEQWRQEFLRMEQQVLDDLAIARAVFQPGNLTIRAGGQNHE